MARRKKYTVEQFRRAIQGGYDDEAGRPVPSSGTIISTIARRLGCDWHTAWDRIQNDPEVKAVYDDEGEKTKDAVQSVLLGSILVDHDVHSAMWWLARKARDRGYGDFVTQEATGVQTVKVLVVREGEPKAEAPKPTVKSNAKRTDG